VGRCLWKRDAPEAIAAIDSQSWVFSHAARLMPVLRESITSRQMRTIGSSVSQITLTELSLAICRSPADTVQLSGSLGWTVDPTATLVYPKAIPAHSGTWEAANGDIFGADTLMRLAQQVAQLERDLPKLETDKSAIAVSSSSAAAGAN